MAHLERNNFALKNLKQIKCKRSIISRLRRRHSSIGVEILLAENEGLLVV